MFKLILTVTTIIGVAVEEETDTLTAKVDKQETVVPEAVAEEENLLMLIQVQAAVKQKIQVAVAQVTKVVMVVQIPVAAVAEVLNRDQAEAVQVVEVLL